jgi:hypothetical protein
MAVYGGPDIVTDGLVLHLDAANSKSYPGSGNTWYDLSGNGNDGTIVPRTDGFSVYDKYLSFPDTSIHPTNVRSYGYVRTPIITGDISYTACVCVRVAANTAAGRHLFRTTGNFGINTISFNRLSFYTTQYNIEAQNTEVNTFFENTWYFICLVYDRDNYNQKLYLNDSYSITKNHATQYSVSTNYQYWLARNDLYTSGLNGDCSFISFYNRPLDENEIIKNYNALKGRFGL